MILDTEAGKKRSVLASAARVDIAPLGQVRLGAASDVEHLPWTGIADPIEANLVLLQKIDSSPPVLVVTLDLLYAGQAVRDVIVRASGLTDDHVLVAASHTHRAPMTDATKPRLGIPTESYLANLLAKLARAVEQLMVEPREECTLAVGQGQAAHSINRRLRKLVVVARRPRVNAVVNAPNPEGVTDETITTMTLRRADGTALAAIWNYGCHPVASPRRHAVSAHFPGVVRSVIRGDENDDSLPVGYLQGFSGNTRPSATTVVHSPGRKMRRMLTGSIFEHMTRDSYEQWASDLAACVRRCRETESLVNVTKISVARAELPGRDFYVPGALPVVFSRISLGRDVALIGLSGEVVAEYAHVVRAALRERYVCCVGCLDHTYGYVPTEAILAEGGYEAGSFCRKFSLEGVAPGVEAAVLSGLSAVAPEATFRHRSAGRA